MLDNILEMIVETVCTKRPLIRIGAEERPAEIIRNRFMKLNVEHIRYVMDCFKENTTNIRNIRHYMLATIYNAPTTIDTYYDALVRHDMSHGYLEGGFKKLKMACSLSKRRLSTVVCIRSIRDISTILLLRICQSLRICMTPF